MRIDVTGAAIGSGLAAEVPPLSLSVVDSAVTVVAVETDERPMLVSMLVGARIRADAGSVRLDGVEDAAAVRAVTALVDTPFVSEPPAGVALATIVREELSFSDLSTSRGAISSFLRRAGLEDHSGIPVRALGATDRIRVFSELALLRRGVRCIVLTSPERHGAAAADWYPVLSSIADRGIAVLVVTDALTRGALLELGARDSAETAPTPEPDAEAEPQPQPQPQPEPESEPIEEQ